MRIKETKLYHFDELSDSAKDKAIQYLSDINVDSDYWFDSIISDALDLGLYISEWDLYRHEIKGHFNDFEENVAKQIKVDHGESTDTYKDAVRYLDSLSMIKASLEDEDDEPNTDDINEEFLRALLQDYLLMLQKDYDYLTSREAIIETINANEYEFTEDGELDS